jgi:hypothetical protein
VTDTTDKSGIAQAPPHMRRGMVERDEHASILKGLARADWLVLLVVALYALALGATGTSRALYAAIGSYALFVVALRWRGFPVRATGARIALGAAVMVAFITVVAARTGGAASPMANLYLLPIVVVAMTLGRQGTLVVFAAVALAFLSLLAGEGPLPPAGELATRLFGQLGPWALVAYLTQALAGTIMSARRRIEEMSERDGLTGMLNLRTFKGLLTREHGLRARDSRGGYAILMVDMDDLRRSTTGTGIRPATARSPRSRAPSSGRFAIPTSPHARAVTSSSCSCRTRPRRSPRSSRSASATTSIAACFPSGKGCSA